MIPWWNKFFNIFSRLWHAGHGFLWFRKKKKQNENCVNKFSAAGFWCLINGTIGRILCWWIVDENLLVSCERTKLQHLARNIGSAKLMEMWRNAHLHKKNCVKRRQNGSSRIDEDPLFDASFHEFYIDFESSLYLSISNTDPLLGIAKEKRFSNTILCKG